MVFRPEAPPKRKMLIYLIVLSASYFHKDVLLLAVGGWGDHGSNDGKMYAATRSLIVENNKIYAEISVVLVFQCTLRKQKS